LFVGTNGVVFLSSAASALLKETYRQNIKDFTSTQGHIRGGGLAGCSPPPKPTKMKFKEHRFCRYYDLKSFTDFPFSRKPLKSADDQYISILKNKLIKFKKQKDRTL
jgi:hypothetical protein